MRAAIHRTYGAPREVLKIEDIEKPTIKDDEVLVSVKYSSVNRTDSGFLQATPFVTRFFSGLLRPKVPVRGCEYSGEVVEVGPSITDYKVGDRVFGFDDVLWGGHAEFKATKTNKMFAKIPDGISFEQAAASTEGTHYAMSYSQTIAKLGAKKVLVHGATGAIGSAAVQVLKAQGLYVVATSTTKNVDLIKSLGADEVIDHEKTDFTLAGTDFDTVFDAVGKSTFKKCKKLLKKRGVYIATELGPHGQNPLFGIISPLFKLVGAKRILFPLPLATKKIMDDVVTILESGKLTPVIDRTYQLDDIVEAYEYVLTGQKTGNVIVQI